jgi:FixJ family two-component response regulator
MNLTEKERLILQLAQHGLSDYKIARKMNSDPPSITRSRKNAHKKLVEAIANIEWAASMGISSSVFAVNERNECNLHSFYL